VETLTPEKITIFEFLDNFSSKMMFLNFKKSFQSMGSSQDISYFTELRQTRGEKKIPKTVLKTILKTKETTYRLFQVECRKKGLFPTRPISLKIAIVRVFSKN
jgi:hypothetical protein